jgi:hypothetical protein
MSSSSCPRRFLHTKYSQNKRNRLRAIVEQVPTWRKVDDDWSTMKVHVRRQLPRTELFRRTVLSNSAGQLHYSPVLVSQTVSWDYA